MRICILVLTAIIVEVQSHGKLVDPPARTSAWRYGFNTPADYNDNELFCGGFNNQFQSQGGKCGICGDPYQGPRESECPNGKYCKKVIVRTYKTGEVIDVKVNLTANHMGYFVFRVCPVTDDNREVTQECLNRFELKVVAANGVKYTVPNANKGLFAIRVKLPDGLSCNRCVFQWDYRAGNTWGKCDDGSMKTGCGPQETFRGCADIKIGNSDSVRDDKKATKMDDNNRPTISPTTKSSETKPVNKEKKGCKSVNNDSRYDKWCAENCAANNCPPSVCKCTSI